MDKQERLLELHHIAQHQLQTLQKFKIDIQKLKSPHLPKQKED